MLEVVLDENIYRFALQSECTLDNRDLLCARMLSDVQTMHRWIFTHEIDEAYRRQFNRNQCRGAIASGLMRSLNEIQRDASRCLLIDEPAVISGEYH